MLLLVKKMQITSDSAKRKNILQISFGLSFGLSKILDFHKLKYII